MEKIALIVVFLLSAVGCATEHLLDSKVYFKRDMQIAVNSQSGEGVLIADQAQSYDITIEAQEDMDLLQISSCARDVDVPAAIESGWFTKKRTYTFTYVPNAVEREMGCVLKFQGLNKSQGKHSWAFIEFKNDTFHLPANLSCNANPDQISDGMSICQTLSGLIMRISFPVEVVTSEKVLGRCKIKGSADSQHFEFQVAPRECAIEFMEKTKPFRKHLLTTIGYEDVEIRSAP